MTFGHRTLSKLETALLISWVKMSKEECWICTVLINDLVRGNVSLEHERNTASQSSQGWWKQSCKYNSVLQKLFCYPFSLGFSLLNLKQLGSSSFKATDCNRKSVVIGSSGMLGEVIEVAALQMILQDFSWQWNQAVEAWLSASKQSYREWCCLFNSLISGGEWEVGQLIGRKLCPVVDEGYLAKRSYSEIKLSMHCLLWKQTENSITSSIMEVNLD